MRGMRIFGKIKIMNPTIYLPIISIIATVIVGVILSKQIKTQKEIINGYKGLVDSVNPDKIIKLHDREIDKIKADMSFDINELKTQIFELATFADEIIEGFQDILKTAKVEEDFRKASIEESMPHCRKLLEEIKQSRLQKEISVKA